MIITKIEQQKRQSGRMNIFLDGEFAFGLHKEVVARFRLRRGDDLATEIIEQITTAEEQTLAKQKALHLLHYRLRSEHELRTKLFEKEFPPQIIDGAIDDLRTLGLVDDVKFARAAVHDAQLRKPTGKHRLQQILRNKGVPLSISRTVIAEHCSDEDETNAALTAAKKQLQRYRHSRKPVDTQHLQKRIARFLTQRGFPWSIISATLKILFNDQELTITED